LDPLLNCQVVPQIPWQPVSSPLPRTQHHQSLSPTQHTLTFSSGQITDHEAKLPLTVPPQFPAAQALSTP
jgi:hypothetical protein